jgi:hypothetical protein
MGVVAVPSKKDLNLYVTVQERGLLGPPCNGGVSVCVWCRCRLLSERWTDDLIWDVRARARIVPIDFMAMIYHPTSTSVEVTTCG